MTTPSLSLSTLNILPLLFVQCAICRVRVQAANAIGVGPYSTAFKFSTRPLPPDAPRLECVQANHNSLKLRWADGKNLDFIHYSVEMQEDGSDKYGNFPCVNLIS